jgi:hypothetical protein
MDSFAQGIYGSWTPFEAIALIRSWAFFGLLQETFKIISTSVEDFIANGVVTTERLPAITREWEYHSQSLGHLERVEEHRQISLYFRSVNIHVENFQAYRNSATDTGPCFSSYEAARTCGCKLGPDYCQDCPTSIIDLTMLTVALLSESLTTGLLLYDIKSPPEESSRRVQLSSLA